MPNMRESPLSVVVLKRREIAREIIRRADTVAILTHAEAFDIYKRAHNGEFDTIFDNEKPQP